MNQYYAKGDRIGRLHPVYSGQPNGNWRFDGPKAFIAAASKDVILAKLERAGFVPTDDPTIKRTPTGSHCCDRCGGRGGREMWPGYVCFDCGGSGYLADSKDSPS